MSVLVREKKPYSDQGIVKHRDYRGDAVNPLKSEAQVHQHPQQGVEGGQASLGAQLASDLRPDDLYVADAKVGKIETIGKSGRHLGVHAWRALQLVE